MNSQERARTQGFQKIIPALGQLRMNRVVVINVVGCRSASPDMPFLSAYERTQHRHIDLKPSPSNLYRAVGLCH